MPSKRKSLWIRLGLVRDQADKHYDQARALHKQRDLVEAIREYEIVLKLDPNYAHAHYYLGLIFAQQHQWDSAIHELEQAQALGITQAENPLSKIQTILSKSMPSQQKAQQVPSLNTTDAIPKLTDNKTPRPYEVVTQQIAVTPSQRLPDDTTPLSSGGVIQQKPEPVGSDTKRNLTEAITCPDLEQVFASGGPVAQLLQTRYRPRPGQVKMANLVRDALQNGKHAVIEAGTGIGKSFAYLVPIVWSGAPAIISTSNKALMDQLWYSDIPKLQQIAPKPFVAALLKGRSNYLCALRLRRLREDKPLPGFDDSIALVEKALQRIPSGDCEQMGLSSSLSEQVTVKQYECKGANCIEYDNCFYERAKTEAAKADIVLTNHALLCTSILHTENRILPIRPILVIDEAHQLEEYAISALTQLFEHKLFWALVNNKIVKKTTEEAEITDQITDYYNRFFQAVRRQRPNNESDKWALTGQIQEGIALWNSLKQIQGHLGSLSRSGDVELLLQQCEDIANTVRAISYVEPEDHIRYCELGEGNSTRDFSAYSVQNRPLEISDVLNQRLFQTWPHVICTSATLSVANDLGWFQRRIGVASANVPTITDTIPSPYNYRQQMLLYTPWGILPAYDEQEEEYVRKLVPEVERLLQASKGRAFVLCTSRKRMEQLYEKLAPQLMLDYPCYIQGSIPRSEIVSKFQQDGNAILFATRSFWEGIDIPGEALSLVILDKMPFQNPEDPVYKRYEQIIKSRGGDSFEELQLSYAILTLRQGAGRLIRSEEDRGVIAILDSRILTKRYGKKIIQSLPAGCHVKSFEAVQNFFSLSHKSEIASVSTNTSHNAPDDMNILPRRKLCEIVTQYGRSIIEDTRRCKALLNDLCGEYRREINLLIMAQEERVASDLQNTPSEMPLPIILPRLVKRLVDNHAVTEFAAQWAVESWVMALGLKSEEK